ncbi:MAG: alanine/ornithine racemase family PLP-dependent enzyme [Clostridium sp.]|nr:alanine/ornithine racemase family PLP-dependent enzyme [Clostridium sp.]
MGNILEIDLRKISENAAAVREVCGRHDIEVLGVTKGFSALPEIVGAIVEGGIEKLADARLENVEMLREEGFRNHMTLLRIPMVSRADRVVRHADCSLNSEMSTIRALSEAAVSAGKVHDVILMLELGDLREGMYPRDAMRMLDASEKLPGVRIAGIGTNMGCYGGILPTSENLSLLCYIAEALERYSGRPIEVVSGGGTSSLQLIAEGLMPKGVNQVRIGEGLLLGTDTTHHCAIPWLHQDAFVLQAEVVEVRSKPSVPIGTIGRDAFGNVPRFEDRGIRKRAIIALGRQDVPPEGLVPLDKNTRVLGGSSDHIILDIEDAEQHYRVGDKILFRLRYQGMLHLCASKYVKKEYR